MCKDHMDQLKIPTMKMESLKDDMKGHGAGLLASNEHLFSMQDLQEWWDETRYSVAEIIKKLEEVSPPPPFAPLRVIV